MNNRVISWLAFGACAATLHLLVADQDGAARTSFSAIAVISLIIATIGLVARKAKAPLPLVLIVAGLGSFQAGQFIYQLQEARTDDWVAFPGPADAAYLLSYPLIATGLWSMTKTAWTKRDFIALTAGAAVSVLTIRALWGPVIGETWGFSGTLMARFVGTAYPVFDALLLGIAAYALFTKPRWQTGLVGLGVGSFVLGDVIYNQQLIEGDFRLGGAAEFFWLMCFVTVAAASLITARSIPSEPVVESPDRDTTLLGV